MHFDLLLVSTARALVEVAGFALIGQGLLALIAGKQRHGNLFYRILQIISGPVVSVARMLSPRFIHDSQVPPLAFFLLFCLWILLALVKRHLCGPHGLLC
ncbi:MAG: hypothetical protein PHD37_02110 [Gallionellaceae bacterium]|nr:hypothetical protein [Gallionellaceae bacterium]